MAVIITRDGVTISQVSNLSYKGDHVTGEAPITEAPAEVWNFPTLMHESAAASNIPEALVDDLIEARWDPSMDGRDVPVKAAKKYDIGECEAHKWINLLSDHLVPVTVPMDNVRATVGDPN